VPPSVTLAVAQRVVVTCSAAGFTGQIAYTIADPTIASVQVVAGTYTLFYVTGLNVGATTVNFVTSDGGTGQLPITVN